MANGGKASLRVLAAAAAAGAFDRGPPLARLELVGSANDPFLLGLLLDPVVEEDAAEDLDLDETDPWLLPWLLLPPPSDSIAAVRLVKYDRWQRVNRRRS